MRKYIALPLILLFLGAKLAAAEVIINTYDWKEAIIGILYAHYVEEDPKLVTSLGEMRLLLLTLNKTLPHTVLESEKKAVVKNAVQSLEVSGFENVTELRFNSYRDMQLSLYSSVKVKIDGFVVVKDKFGLDAIPVIPYAMLKNYWILFYDEQNEEELINFLNNEAKNVVFYGKFERRPWKKLSPFVSFEIIDNRNYKDNMLNIFDRFIEEERPKWVMIMSGRYLEDETLNKVKPILLTILDPKEVVQTLLQYNITIAEVIGPENVDYASQIRELSGKRIGVVVKTGRTFTGIEELRGFIYPIKTLDVPYPAPELKIEKVYLNQKENKLVILFNNTGNVGVHFYISGISLSVNNRFSYPEFSPVLHFLEAGEFLSIPIEYNGSLPDFSEILVLYGYEKPINIQVNQTLYNVTLNNYPDFSNLVLKDMYYDKFGERLVFELQNLGNETVYTTIEVFDFNYFDENVTLSSGSPVALEPGESKTLSISLYLDEEDIQNNKVLNVFMLYGPLEDMMLNAETLEMELRVVESPLTAFIIFVQKFGWIVIVLIIVVAAVIYLLFSKRKKGKKRSK